MKGLYTPFASMLPIYIFPFLNFFVVDEDLEDILKSDFEFWEIIFKTVFLELSHFSSGVLLILLWDAKIII